MTFEENNKLELVLKHVFLPDDWGHPALWQWAYRGSNGNHICIVIQWYMAIAVLWFQYIAQVTSNIFK